MPELKTLFQNLERENPRDTANIAGYIGNDKNFYYQISTSENLPAAAVVFDLVGKASRQNAKVYTNLRKAHWIYTYTSSAEGEGNNDLVHVSDTIATAMEARSMGGRGQVRLLAGEGRSPGPIHGGGLYLAAKGLHDSETRVISPDDHSKLKGLHRAVRYYMLAAYALLGKCAGNSYEGGHYIAGLLVDDSGRILSYGVNSGGFHHGETNMLLNYFRTHSGDQRFPANTIVFSTLTPCVQCSKYLETTRPGESVIFIGQKDTGSKGREGEKFGKHLSAVTDPIQNRVAKPIMATRPTGQTKTLPGMWGKAATTVQITEEVQVGEKVTKNDLESLLALQMREGASIAEQIGPRCGDLLSQSRGTFKHKFQKTRDRALEDQLIKQQVLEYLNTWMEAVGNSSALKTIS